MTAYQRALDELERGNYDAARTAIREALASDPELPNGENLAGWIEYSSRDRTAEQLEAAIEHFRRAIARSLDEVAAIGNLANALLAAERPGDAITALEALDSAVAHNWLGWFFTAQQPDLPRAITHLEAATATRPHWGVPWSNLATALDATGELARACTAFATAIECGDAHDDTYARDRRLQIEMILRNRGEVPPPPPATARADSVAADMLAAAAQDPALSHGRTFVIWPTTQPPRGERAFALIGATADGRTSAAMFVADGEAFTPMLARVELATAAEQLARAIDAHALTALDVAIALRAALTSQTANPWWLRADTTELAIAEVGGQVVVVVRPRAAGGVTIIAPALTLDAPNVDALREAMPALIAATRRELDARRAFAERAIGAGQIAKSLVAALRDDDPDGWRDPSVFDRYPRDGRASVSSARAYGVWFELTDDTEQCTVRIDETSWTLHAGDELDRAAIVETARVALARLRFAQLGLHERFRVIAPFGPFAPGSIIELASDSFDPRGDYREVVFRGPGGDYALTDGASASAIYNYLVRASARPAP